MKVCTRKSAIWAGLGLLLGSTIAASAVPVTFQVNMEVQIAAGTFNPASDLVEARGSFNGWGGGFALSSSPADANLYVGTVDISGTAGSTVQFKFVLNSTVWESRPNRTFALAGSDQTLPVFFFNDESALPGVVAVTFQLNTAIQEAIGTFDPATHAVEARGSFDAWGAGIVLTASSTNAHIYQGTVDVTGAPGATIEHKFVINQAGTILWEGNVGPGGPNGNRTFALADTPQVLPVVYFNNLTNDPGAGIAVTFQVNMAVQTALGTFDPASGTMVVAGQFNNWSTTATPLTNSPGNTHVYAGTVKIKASSGSSVPYKFVMNGNGWEAGDNRVFTLASPEQTLPVVYYNGQSDLGALAFTFVASDQVEVSWTAGPGVRLQKTASLADPWQDVPDTAGQSSMTFTVTSGTSYFRLAGP